MTAFAHSTLAMPSATGLCAGCKDVLTIGGAYCTVCNELNKQLEAARLKRVQEIAGPESSELSEHARARANAERLARLCAAMPRIDGQMPVEHNAWVVKIAETLSEVPYQVVLIVGGVLLVGFWGAVGCAVGWGARALLRK